MRLTLILSLVLSAVILLVAAIAGLTALGSGSSDEAEGSAENPDVGILELPRVPWEGGPEYWNAFERAERWTDPAFFPIGIWYNSISSDEEVQWDKDHGINTYLGLWEGTSFPLIAGNDMYWVGGRLNETFDTSSANWPGVILDDEVDGRFDPEEGLQHLHDIAQMFDERPEGEGRFRYANYTQLVIGPDMDLDHQERYVNDFTDAVSLDMYWYTVPFCDHDPYRGEGYAVPVPQDTCRSASSYGKTMQSLTIRDSVDGALQPRWQFVENLNGLSGQEHVAYIEPEQLKGAAMASIIGEARGIVWFNQSLTGPCQTSEALRIAQVEGPGWCGSPQIEAMGQINNLIHDLAPVINTQSYEWSFGEDVMTMLKVHENEAYVFAMTDGGTGTRQFSLPQDVQGVEAEAIGEDRSLAIVNGAFEDDFDHEHDFHIYRVPL